MSMAAVDKHCARALADLRAALERRGLPPGARA
jgi:RNA polymerase sigma-70 factor (ECF subfamily)